MSFEITYELEPDLSGFEFLDILIRSGLGERRPIGEPERLEGMLRKADVIVAARVDGLIVGISRAISDFHFCTYLSDLAVDRSFQKNGIGRELIRRTHEAAGLHTRLILLAAPAAESYYPHIGMEKHPSCWTVAGK